MKVCDFTLIADSFETNRCIVYMKKQNKLIIKHKNLTFQTLTLQCNGLRTAPHSKYMQVTDDGNGSQVRAMPAQQRVRGQLRLNKKIWEYCSVEHDTYNKCAKKYLCPRESISGNIVSFED